MSGHSCSQPDSAVGYQQRKGDTDLGVRDWKKTRKVTAGKEGKRRSI